ncbi:hypothetical protein [Alkalihalobacterium chitinilyticum]|uniref:Uncharacterized protein n=1 Tax=Alkalihalobacterium chitinilyticum TaxID=2980103 RepID=A0ABT5VFQ7_9BACI|nr:hypothetical protein [Alkalihalobacterium chitinilyticum]MDE5414289.1 hypothetical protein [Alkalihalobacterium chitinilyticum]
MDFFEEKGRTLLLEVIGILLILAVISFLTEPDAFSLFVLLLNIGLWGVMYKGYFWAKIVTVIWLFIQVVIYICTSFI